MFSLRTRSPASSLPVPSTIGMAVERRMPGYRPTVAKLPSASSQGSTGRLRFSAEEVAFFVPRAFLLAATLFVSGGQPRDLALA